VCEKSYDTLSMIVEFSKTLCSGANIVLFKEIVQREKKRFLHNSHNTFIVDCTQRIRETQKNTQAKQQERGVWLFRNVDAANKKD
jgi:hypothetical protein